MLGASVIAIAMCWLVRHVRRCAFYPTEEVGCGRGNTNEHDVLSAVSLRRREMMIVMSTRLGTMVMGIFIIETTHERRMNVEIWISL